VLPERCRVWAAGSPVRTTLLWLIVKGAGGDGGNDLWCVGRLRGGKLWLMIGETERR
jgi:hypothetical protein